jgi:hypothetical protein
MALKQTKAIRRLYDEILDNGLIVPANETITNIISLCEERGQFIFHGDSYWSFVKTQFKDRSCIRMIFALKSGDSGKVYNLGRITTLIKDLEEVLTYIDNIDVVYIDDFIYVDAIKYLQNS